MGAGEGNVAVGAIVLFDEFETLDVFGPVSVLGKLSHKCAIRLWSADGQMVRSVHGVEVNSESFPSDPDELHFVLIPGGNGTRALTQDHDFLTAIKTLCSRATYVLSVCTGSAVVAATGIMDGRRATSNKRALQWVCNRAPGVQWVGNARWVVDGKFYTSSGVSAGIDMALAFVRDTEGQEVAEEFARGMEYLWNSDPDNDPFARDVAAR